MRRNISDYERAGIILKAEAGDLVDTVESLHKDVAQWVKEHHPYYL